MVVGWITCLVLPPSIDSNLSSIADDNLLPSLVLGGICGELDCWLVGLVGFGSGLIPVGVGGWFNGRLN